MGMEAVETWHRSKANNMMWGHRVGSRWQRTSCGTLSSVWQICTSMRIRRVTWYLTPFTVSALTCSVTGKSKALGDRCELKPEALLLVG
jgi:hypothetical protein